MDFLGNLPNELVLRIFEFLAPEPFELSDTKNLERVGPWSRNKSSMDSIQWGDFLTSRSTLLALTDTARFTQRAAMPLLYRNVVFNNRLKGIRKFLHVLANHPERGRWVEQITWLLPHPIEDCGLRESLGLELRRHGLFTATEVNLDRVSEEYREPLRHLSRLPRDSWGLMFPADYLGPIALPLLSFTPNLVTLNISGYQDWCAEAAPEVRDDPFFRFLDCDADPTPLLPRTITYLFPLDRFKVGRDNTGKPVGLTFPPPRLQTIVRSCKSKVDYYDDYNFPSTPHKYITERLSLLSHEKAVAIARLSRQMRDRLGIVIDDRYQLLDVKFLAPSTILRSSTETYMDLCQYINGIRSLDILKESTLDEQLNWFRCLTFRRRPGMPIAFSDSLDMLDNLPHVRKFGEWLIAVHKRMDKRLPMVARHSLRCSMADVLQKGLDVDGARKFVGDLTLVHPHHEWVPLDVTGFRRAYTLGACIMSQMPHLQVLNMDLDNRNAIYSQFNPFNFEHVTELTITIEALWGPVQTVMAMLVGDESHHDDSDMIWSMRRKAVGRLTVHIRTLRLIDWFAEYHLYTPAEQDDPANEAEELAQAGVDDGNGAPDEQDAANPPNPNDPMAATAFYKYPPRLQHPDFAPDDDWKVVAPRDPHAFASKYIHALREGLYSLCNTPTPGSHSEMSLVNELRPELTRLEFVYRLQSEEDPKDPERRKADNEWRKFCDREWRWNTHSCGILARILRDNARIQLVLWEGSVGNPPLPPDDDAWEDDVFFKTRMR